MARYVLDTHAVVFHLVAPAKLGRSARAALRRVDEGREEAWIPAAAIAEVSLLRELGRVHVGLPEIRTVLRDAPTIHFLPLDLEQLDEFAGLALLRDPFDRLMVAAARHLDAVMVTRDERIADSGLVEVVWS